MGLITVPSGFFIFDCKIYGPSLRTHQSRRCQLCFTIRYHLTRAVLHFGQDLEYLTSPRMILMNGRKFDLLFPQTQVKNSKKNYKNNFFSSKILFVRPTIKDSVDFQARNGKLDELKNVTEGSW